MIVQQKEKKIVGETEKGDREKMRERGKIPAPKIRNVEGEGEGYHGIWWQGKCTGEG